MPGLKLERVKAEFERLFRRYGIPRTIQCDNGSPFICTRARGGLTRLSAWWVALGIDVVRSRPGCPQDNGAHERMHRDISEEVQSFPELSRQSQQRALDRWRQTFNHVRPHEALGGKVPAEIYTEGKRRSLAVAAFGYPPSWCVRRVHGVGSICVDSVKYLIGRALVGYDVALEPIGGLNYRLWFRRCDLGELELAPSLDDLEFQLAKNPKKPFRSDEKMTRTTARKPKTENREPASATRALEGPRAGH